jgi:hypothetical protein
MDDATLLAALETLILKRINGDAYIEYASATMRFRGSSLEELMRVRDDLKARIAAANGSNFHLGSMFRS